METAFLIVPILIALMVLIRIGAGVLDHSRINAYVASLGGELLSARWSPFGPGWYGEKRERIYAIRYLDREGHEHSAYCKTSLLASVYFTEDRIVRQSATAPPERESLVEENRRLRQEIARLKRRLGEE
ncbi:MAG TPA: hypothetical protein VL132_10260 [Planctomycetaceae bacterium]|nr:hypothetical protein [Planctomycetaceae bacterium]